MLQASAVQTCVKEPTMRIIREIKIQRLELDDEERRGYTVATFTGEWSDESESGVDQLQAVCDDVETKPDFSLYDSDEEVRVPARVARLLGELLDHATAYPKVMESLGSIRIEWHAAEPASGLDMPFFCVHFETNYVTDSAMGINHIVAVSDEGESNVGYFLAEDSTEVRIPASGVRSLVRGIFDRIQHL